MGIDRQSKAILIVISLYHRLMRLQNIRLLPVFTIVLSVSNVQAYTDSALFRQNFEEFHPDFYWFTHPEWYDNNLFIKYYTYGNINGRIVQARYIPSNVGSKRIVKNFRLNDVVNAATLSFDMKLHSQFEFVRGGKLHGIGGGRATTGCDPIVPNGWSVRMMWRSEGEPELYIYHQDRAAQCGDSFRPVTHFRFGRGVWYRIDIYVKMNTDINSADGQAALYIDGEKMVDVRGLNLAGDSMTKINKFLFQTFYGGSDTSWSPSKNTYIYFDNFTVHSGKKISGEEGTTCEIFKEGVLNSGRSVCCSESCGSCGGPGCGSLPGRGANCCTSDIIDNGLSCDQQGIYAPCNL